MDVQCERCKTEYDFDDALVSGRGTTVRCTSCGHQFKVRRPDADGAEQGAGDRWQVRTSGGQVFTFVTLRELQRAILAGQVSRADQLYRAGAPPRALGAISELEPFFLGQTSGAGGGAAAAGPPSSTAPPAFPGRSVTWTDDESTVPRLQPHRTADFGVAPPAPPVPAAHARRKVDTLRPPAGIGAPPPPVVTERPPAAIVPQVPARPPPPPPPPPPPVDAARTVMGRTQVLPAIAGPRAAASEAPPQASPPIPPPPPPVMRQPHAEPREARSSIPWSGDEPFSVPRGRRVGGWIVAFVLMLAVGVVGWAVAKPYLVARTARAAAQLDPRAASFLSEGEKDMADGDLESAQHALDKASALAESDPRVLADEARVAAAEADVPWLKLRLLPPGEADEVRTTKAQVDDRVARARRAADAAVASAPEDPAVIRARVDALRLAGEESEARTYVSKIIAQASQPETAYVLAALDLAEPEPLWKTVIERLRLAAAGEGNAGRARAALVYALAKSGDAAGAKAELAKLDALTRPYPISPNLHALVDKVPAGKAAGAGSSAPAAAARTTGGGAQPPAPTTQAPRAGGGGAPAGGAGEGIPSDPRVAIQMAANAVRIGSLPRAQQLYQSVVDKNPNDSEALAGLGDVARIDGETALAITQYKRAIAVNPSYLPALLGLADTQWSSGDKAGALRGYTEIVDRFPEGTYPAYVKKRSEASVPAPAATAPAKSADEGTKGETGE